MSDGTIVDAGFQANEDQANGVAAPEPCEPKISRLTVDERDKLRALRERQREAQRKVDDWKSELKSARVSLEAWTDAISRYIDSLDQPQLPFGEKPAEAGEDWRSVSLADAIGAAVTISVLECLAEAQLRTVGELADFTCQSQLTDVAGIGQAKAEQIEQALEAFWAARKIEDLADQVPALEGDNA